MTQDKDHTPLGKLIDHLGRLKHWADSKYGFFSRFCQFCFVGGTGMVVDLATYALFLAMGVNLMLARASAIWVAMTWNFWLNRRITFSYSRGSGVLQQYVKFVLSCLLGALISWSTAMGLSFGSEFFHERLFLAAIIGIILGTIFNFALSALWVFERKAVSRDGAAKQSDQRNAVSQQSDIKRVQAN
jgi:dolichol-phosphate mannosyltransferase